MTVNDAAERDYPHRPFAVRAISVLAYAQGFTLWHYKCDADTRPLAPGFFNAAGDMLAIGDMILVSGGGIAGLLCVAQVTPDVRVERVTI
jgi:hypothetical protein